jgi:2-isopropylmalate synthase
MNKQLIRVFDTTLRDGQQCPGAGMSLEDNIEYARLAKQVGVDVLEAGFPSASSLDFKIVNLIAEEYSQDKSCPYVAALCQLREQQIDKTIEALAPVTAIGKGYLHVYLPVDPELMQASLGDYANDKDKMLKDLNRLVQRSVDAGLKVEFSPEGYSRMGENFDFVTDTIRAVVSAGASVINCPDTIGGACKWQGEDYFVEKMKQHAEIIKKEFPQQEVTWSAHCHNDFGLALDNTMNSVFLGPVRQIEGCFNGVGERAGNASLEQCIMYLDCFGKNNVSDQHFYTEIKKEHIKTISDFVSEKMLPRQPHWPVSGENSAKHSSGGHTNAIINNPLAYQPFDPADVGNSISFMFGPLSGGNHAKNIIVEAGYICEDSEKVAIGQYIKDYYQDRRKGITDRELLEAYLDYRKPIKVQRFNYKHLDDQSTLRLEGDFFDKKESSLIKFEEDDSALATLHKAITQHMTGLTISNYKSEAMSQGIEAVSQSKIIVEFKDKQYDGLGEDKNILISAFKALIDATNQAYIAEHFKVD